MTGIVDELLCDPITPFTGADTNVSKATDNHVLNGGEHGLEVSVGGGAEQPPVVFTPDSERKVVVQYALMRGEVLEDPLAGRANGSDRGREDCRGEVRV